MFSHVLQRDKILSSFYEIISGPVIFNQKWKNIHRKGIWNLLQHMVETQISRAAFQGKKHSLGSSQNTSDVNMLIRNFLRRNCTLRFTCL